LSVLVEALSLIIPRKVLDLSYPGGTDAFMRRMCDPEVPSRRVCADDQLVSVSFLTGDDAQVVGRQLLDHGIVAVDEGHFQEMAFVDQRQGPTMPCDWLEWRRHEEGYTYCWVAGTDPEPMRAPADWTPEQSRAFIFHDIRDEPGRCLKLAEEEGREIWIDFQTGAIDEGPPLRATADSPADHTASEDATTMGEQAPEESDSSWEGDGGVLLSIVRAMLDGHGYRYQQLDAESLSLTIRNEHGTYAVFFNAKDATDLVRLSCSYGSNAPEDRRVAVAEAMTRINARIGLGNFELDFQDGEMRYRTGMDVEEGLLSEKMADNMLGVAFYYMDRFHDALMAVAFGGAEPAVAVAEVP
jgi:hypothetical protein